MRSLLSIRFLARTSLFLVLAGCWVTGKEVQDQIDGPTTNAGDADTDTDADTDADTDTDSGTLPTGTPGGTVTTMPCVDEDLGFAVGDAVRTGTTSGEGNDESPTCFGAVPGNGPDVVYSWSASNTACFAVSTVGSDFDSVLYLREGSCSGPEVGCNDNRSETDLTSEIGLSAVAGTTYVVVLDGHDGGDVGNFELNINPVNAIPVDFDLGSLVGSTNGNNIGEDDTLEHTLCPLGSGSDVIAKWTAPSDKLWTFSIATSGADFDTTLSLWRPCTERDVVCEDAFDGLYPYGGETVQLQLYQGEEILIRIAGYQPAYGVPEEGTFTLEIQ